MLLFSTILEINEKMTKEAFIKLVIEWNQNGHPDNVIEGIAWEGEYNVCYRDDNKWLDIQEYRNKNIIAVRNEKREADGTVWDTDYIMNFDDMKMAVRLDRSYGEDVFEVNTKFYTPYFIAMLIDRGYVKNDGDFEVLRYPLYIDARNLDVWENIVNGKAKHKLPIVLVSKTFSNEDPISISVLSKALKGIAHIIVQKDCSTNVKLKEVCEGKNEYNGAIGLYHPNPSIGNRRYLYSASEERKQILLEKIIRIVMQYNNAQLVEPLYTWYGVINALLNDRLYSNKLEQQRFEIEKRIALYQLRFKQAEEKEAMKQKQAEEIEAMEKEIWEKAKKETDELLEAFDEELREKDRKINELSNKLLKAEQEASGYKAKLNSNTEVPVIIEGEQGDYYPGEIKDFVLSAIKKEIDNTAEMTRRRDVLEDILKANNYQEINKTKAENLKRLLHAYKGMTPKIRKGLEELGFVFDPSDHQKLKYFGEDRYTVIYGSTPGDKGHGGKNNVSTTIKKAF